MWFIFGFITLISFSIYTWHKKINASWKGTPGKHNNISYQYKVTRGKHKIGVMIGIEGLPNYDFSLKRESTYDKFFKIVRISKEHQVGRPLFDDSIYIVSDDEYFHSQLTNNHELTDSFVKLFDHNDKRTYKLKDVRNNSGRLWVNLKTHKEFGYADIYKMFDRFVPLLHEINTNLDAHQPNKRSRWKDPFTIKAAIILAISTGLAINGLVHIFRIFFTKIPFTIDQGPLLYNALILGIGITAFLIASTLFLLKTSARTHLVLSELLIFGLFGAVSSAYSGLHDYNMGFDHSHGSHHEVTVSNKKINITTKSRTYELYVNDWTSEKLTRKVKVSRSFYHDVAIGNQLIILQSPGALNYRWVKSIEKKT